MYSPLTSKVDDLDLCGGKSPVSLNTGPAILATGKLENKIKISKSKSLPFRQCVPDCALLHACGLHS